MGFVVQLWIPDTTPTMTNAGTGGGTIASTMIAPEELVTRHRLARAGKATEIEIMKATAPQATTAEVEVEVVAAVGVATPVMPHTQAWLDHQAKKS